MRKSTEEQQKQIKQLRRLREKAQKGRLTAEDKRAIASLKKALKQRDKGEQCLPTTF